MPKRTPPETITPLSTRLFPRDMGADAYSITGIAKRCDWVVLSDHRQPHTHLVQHKERHPRHIFVSLRVPRTGLHCFADEILPRLSEPFILITGSEDATLPHQVDVRQQPFRPQEHKCLSTILNHPLLKHWFIENLDTANWSPKVSPLPVGFVWTDPANADRGIQVPRTVRLFNRRLRMLCAHRTREGGQWQQRRDVTAMARAHWSDFCTVIEDPVSEEEFTTLMQSHAFVLCVEGGGLDPSPKAWQTILNGAIPIIRKNGPHKAYEQLPVIMVEQWSADQISEDRLIEHRNSKIFDFDTISGRNKTLERLGIEYWWQQIESAGK
ncbi:MAG: hypothetical protein AAF950_01290 [Pseudomonadota bacterium]